MTERNYIITYIYIYFLQTKYYQMCESNTLLILGSLNSLNTMCLTRSFMSTIYIVIFEAGSNLQISCFLNERFKYTVLSTLHIILKHSLKNYCKSFLCMFGAFSIFACLICRRRNNVLATAKWMKRVNRFWTKATIILI